MLSALEVQRCTNLPWTATVVGYFGCRAFVPVGSHVCWLSLWTEPRELANSSWALSVLHYQDRTLFHAIASSAIPNRRHVESETHLLDSSWAVAHFGSVVVPLCHSLAASAIRTLSFNAGGLSTLSWAYDAFDMVTHLLYIGWAASFVTCVG